MPTPRKYASIAERQAAYRQRREAARRAAIEAQNMPATAAIATMPSTARWKALRDQAQAILQMMQDEMEAYRDERSQAWQESDKADAFQEIIDQLEAARASVEDVALD